MAYRHIYPEEKIMRLESELKQIAESIHYPDCWDTVAYPTLYDAIRERGCNPEDCTRLNEGRE